MNKNHFNKQGTPPCLLKRHTNIFLKASGNKWADKQEVGGGKYADDTLVSVGGKVDKLISLHQEMNGYTQQQAK